MTVLERLVDGRGSEKAKKERAGGNKLVGRLCRKIGKSENIPFKMETLDGIEQQLYFLIVGET